MPGRSAHQALTRYLNTIRKVLACITDAPLQVERDYRFGVDHELRLNYGKPLLLPGRVPVYLRWAQIYRFVVSPSPIRTDAPVKVSLTQYYYTLETRDEEEYFAFHYHPVRDDPDPTPHLHLGPAAGEFNKLPGHLHLPSGRLPVEDLVWFLHNDFGTVERVPNWKDLLRTYRTDFNKYRSR